MLELDPDVLTYFENELNDLADNSQTKFGKTIGPELAVVCASLATQLVLDGGSTEKQFLHFMTEIWRSMEENDAEQQVNVRLLTIKKKDLDLN